MCKPTVVIMSLLLKVLVYVQHEGKTGANLKKSIFFYCATVIPDFIRASSILNKEGNT